LSDEMSSDPNTIASLLERMEAGGLVRRRPHEQDRRAYRLRIRPAGRRKYEEVREIALALQAEVLAALPKPKRREFLEHLDLVAASCRLAACPELARPEPARPEPAEGVEGVEGVEGPAPKSTQTNVGDEVTSL
jgi:hypothetical protein